jgi:hypothetical protein
MKELYVYSTNLPAVGRKSEARSSKSEREEVEKTKPIGPVLGPS